LQLRKLKSLGPTSKQFKKLALGGGCYWAYLTFTTRVVVVKEPERKIGTKNEGTGVWKSNPLIKKEKNCLNINLCL